MGVLSEAHDMYNQAATDAHVCCMCVHANTRDAYIMPRADAQIVCCTQGEHETYVCSQYVNKTLVCVYTYLELTNTVPSVC